MTKSLPPLAMAVLVGLVPMETASAQQADPATVQQPNVALRRLSPDQVRQVAPALEQLTQQPLYGEVWKRADLSPRDRSLVTIAAMIIRGEAPALSYYANQAIENGVKPSEISETIVHLAFYAGWSKAFAAVGPVHEVFAKRGVQQQDLPPALGPLLPLAVEEDEARSAGVRDSFSNVSAGVVDYTNDLLFRQIWQRPYLSARDRSLVTIAALIADGKAQQLTYHLNRGMDHGLSEGEVGEVLTQLAFYAGWPSVFSALPVVKDVFAKRQAAAQ
ncbi:carboxymuconolactone decarboxylase family protein [Sphingomonas pituitosa]|uniref:carboxymuconolactone decarboxylase family protein n=1 Tax=Sphingomonas pituitosa TaxID=99597 RepID=UPI001C3F62CB|nr:carboxymuconolactone decarboxylase family protein [Sphingomonas pituitosa]